MVKQYIATIPLILLLLIPLVSAAHGSGLAFSQEAEGYYVDVDYSDSAVEAGQTGRFTFDIFTEEERRNHAPFTDLWVRIEGSDEENEVLFAGPIYRPEFGDAGFSFLFSESGEYTLHVRYHNEGTTLAETSFPIAVEPAQDAPMAPGFMSGLIAGLLIGAGSLWLLLRKRS